MKPLHGEHRRARTPETNGARAARTNGAVAEELPIPNFERMSARAAVAAVRVLDEAADLAAIDRYETQHKNREVVRGAVRDRTAALAR
jgi:hypothetical protein